MKTIIFALASMISLSTQASEKGGSDVQSGNISTKLECYIATNPQDASIQLQDYEGGNTVKSETALILTVDLTKDNSSDTKFQMLKAESKTLSFDTGAIVMRTENGRRGQIECDGGGWDITYLTNGDLRISKVSARGEIINNASDEGCIGVGTIKASKPINLVKVTCRK